MNEVETKIAARAQVGTTLSHNQLQEGRDAHRGVSCPFTDCSVSKLCILTGMYALSVLITVY